jgi:formylglycine-generating enzyme required for sulfatase activity
LQFTTEYGIEFSTIGDVGNPVVPPEVGPFFYSPGAGPLLVGAVDYEYRIARTEVTVAQWADFITAYRPHYTGGNPNFTPFTGLWITWSSSQQRYVYDPETAQYPTDCSWRVAAAYCNWLHNDRVTEAWAFASGAYDTSTFGELPSGEITDQREHSPGARFWIPTLDEWTKGMHWDPNRNGPGEGGYWVYPTSSDEAPIPGAPGLGQTNGGLPNSSYFPVGSYATVQSPWGLFDGSGGEPEWTEYLANNRTRVVRGSEPGLSPDIWDRVDWLRTRVPFGPGEGLRIAAAVPAPGPFIPLIAAMVCISFKRRRT